SCVRLLSHLMLRGRPRSTLCPYTTLFRSQDQETIDGLAKEVAGKGLTGVQLALGKSFPELNTSVGSLSPGLARHIGDQFRNNNVDRKSTRLNSSHVKISYAVFCLKKKRI